MLRRKSISVIRTAVLGIDSSLRGRALLSRQTLDTNHPKIQSTKKEKQPHPNEMYWYHYGSYFRGYHKVQSYNLREIE